MKHFLILGGLLSIMLIDEIKALTLTIEPSVTIGRNGIMSESDSLVGGWVWGATLNESFPLSEAFSLSTGVGFVSFRSIGLRDYSIQFGCDNRDGMADPFNSWYEYGRRGSYLQVPLLAQYKMGRVELEMGFVGNILLKDSDETILYECGKASGPRQRDVSSFDLASFNFGAVLGGNIGLDKTRRLRVKPRVTYVFSDVADDAVISFNTLIYELGIGFRFAM